MVTLPLHRLRSRNVCDKKRLLFAHITWWGNQRKFVGGSYTAENFCLRFRFIYAFEFFAKFPKSSQKTWGICFFFNSLMKFFLIFVISKPSRNISEHKMSHWATEPWTPINKHVALGAGHRNCCSWEPLSSDSLLLLERYSRISKS